METDKELEERFGGILVKSSTPASYYDRNVEMAVALLGISVMRLKRSSDLLARVNIGVGAIIFIVGVWQLVLMLRGH